MDTSSATLVLDLSVHLGQTSLGGRLRRCAATTRHRAGVRTILFARGPHPSSRPSSDWSANTVSIRHRRISTHTGPILPAPGIIIARRKLAKDPPVARPCTHCKISKILPVLSTFCRPLVSFQVRVQVEGPLLEWYMCRR
jgi:hypothetical protein